MEISWLSRGQVISYLGDIKVHADETGVETLQGKLLTAADTSLSFTQT